MSFSISSFDSSPALHNDSNLESAIPSRNIDLGLLADSHGETTTNTLDRGQGVDDLLLSINVSVEDTKNVLELSLVNKRLRNGEQTCHKRHATPTMLLLHYFAKRAFHKLGRHNRGKVANRKTTPKSNYSNKHEERKEKKAQKKMDNHP